MNEKTKARDLKLFLDLAKLFNVQYLTLDSTHDEDVICSIGDGACIVEEKSIPNPYDFKSDRNAKTYVVTCFTQTGGNRDNPPETVDTVIGADRSFWGALKMILMHVISLEVDNNALCVWEAEEAAAAEGHDS